MAVKSLVIGHWSLVIYQDFGGDAIADRGDVSDMNPAQACVEATINQYGTLDIQPGICVWITKKKG
ncbi:hypothetical protein [Coleofasciculus sp. E1-EBD-02]|uniref:hypothetical protein n=1 Tax=Coleofasciculus sp. E1-EBD-02 TaxID=3068481 RepID=UPI0032FF1613